MSEVRSSSETTTPRPTPTPLPPRKRRRSSTTSRNKHRKSRLQLELEFAIQGPAGVRRALDVLARASESDARRLSDDGWSPLAGAILRVGFACARRRRNRVPTGSASNLSRLAELCKERGLSADDGAVLGAHLHRPLVLAAYYGLVDVVEKLLDVGASPNLRDGDGRTAWHAAFQNPTGQRRVLRECDREVARTLIEKRRVVTANLTEWRRAPANSLVYANGEADNGSPLLCAVRNGNAAVARFLVDHGVVLTDRDWLALSGHSGGARLLLSMVATLSTSSSSLSNNNNNNDPRRWCPEADWSFPPTWKVAVALTGHCGLPEDLFRDHVLSFCGRDWFFTQRQYDEFVPARSRSSGRVW